MLGNNKPTDEQKKKNEEWQKSMIEKAGAKGIEVVRNLDDLKVGDVLQIRERDRWEIKIIQKGDLTKEFGFTKLFNRNFMTGVQRFTF